MDKGYDSHTYEKVGQWFEEHREEMAEDIKRLVRIPSISDPEAETGPFGKACRDAMDEMLAMGRKYGFFRKIKNTMWVPSAGKRRTGIIQLDCGIIWMWCLWGKDGIMPLLILW